MNKRILCWLLIICVCTSTVLTRPIQARAAASSAALGTATAAKILVALFAMAGVVFAAENYQDIWDGNGLDVEAIINNMTQFDRDLGMAMKTYITMGTAGAMTIIMNRHVWNLFQAYCRDKFGTDTETETVVSTIKKEIKPLEAGNPYRITYVVGGRVGDITLVFDRDVLVFITPRLIENGVDPVMYYLTFVPTAFTTYAEAQQMYSNMSLSVTGYNAIVSSGASTQLSAEAGYCYGLSLSINLGVIFTETSFIGASAYTTSSYNVDSNYLSTVNTRTIEYRQTNKLEVSETVTAHPAEGLVGQAVTAAGQDVISFGNTALQEGSDVVIEGDLTIALPAEDVLGEELKDLADGETTYEEYVAALGLAAVATTEETAEEIQEKQEAIATYPISGVYTVSLNDLFPFCIPFDLYDLISAFNADPVAPEVTISLPVGYDGTDFTWQDYTLSLSPFDQVAQVARIFEYVLFCIGLMMITRKLIEG